MKKLMLAILLVLPATQFATETTEDNSASPMTVLCKITNSCPTEE